MVHSQAPLCSNLSTTFEPKSSLAPGSRGKGSSIVQNRTSGKGQPSFSAATATVRHTVVAPPAGPSQLLPSQELCNTTHHSLQPTSAAQVRLCCAWVACCLPLQTSKVQHPTSSRCPHRPPPQQRTTRQHQMTMNVQLCSTEQTALWMSQPTSAATSSRRSSCSLLARTSSVSVPSALVTCTGWCLPEGSLVALSSRAPA